MTHAIKPRSFSGHSLLGQSEGGLVSILRGLAVDNACTALVTLNPGDFTDNSTGTAAATFAAPVLAPAAFDSSGGNGAPNAAFNTAVGKVANAHKVIIGWLAGTRTKLGLPALSYADGTVATPGTIPALDKTLTASTGTNSISLASYTAAIAALAHNQAILVTAFHEIQTAVGLPLTGSALEYPVPADYSLGSVPAGVAVSTAAGDAVSKAVADAALTLLAANVATLAADWAELLDHAASATRPLNVIAARV